MSWTLIYLDDNGRELRSSAMKSRNDALSQAHETRKRYTIIRVEGPGVTLDAAQIEQELASGRYTASGMAIPKR